MGGIFSRIFGDEVEQLRQRLAEKDQRLAEKEADEEVKNLAIQLLAFRGANSSTSTSQDRAVVDANVPIRGVSAAVLVQECTGKSADENIPSEDYANIQKTIKSKINKSAGEVHGYQPRHRQQIEACLEIAKQIHPKRMMFKNTGVAEVNRSKVSRKLMKIPDSFVGYGNDAYLVLLADEVKLDDDIAKSIRQAISYAIATLIVRLEVARSITDMVVYCVATDGKMLAVGRVSVLNGELEICASLQSSQCLELDSPSGQAPGLLALVHLFSASDERLGFTPMQAAVFNGNRVDTVLGLGGFCTVYQCSPLQGGAQFAIKTRAYVHQVTAKRSVVEAQIHNEIVVLKALQSAGVCSHVSALSVAQCPAGTWIGLRDISMRLDQFLHPLPRGAARVSFLKLLDDHLRAAVVYIHKVGYAHNDLRPDNVAVCMSSAGPCVQLIDFGLATPLVESMFHRYEGGRAYFHDAIVLALARREHVAVAGEQDCASASYVLYAAQAYDRVTGTYDIPWKDVTGDELVQCRADAMRKAQATVWIF